MTHSAFDSMQTMTSLVEAMTVRRGWSGEVVDEATINHLYACTRSAWYPFTYAMGSTYLLAHGSC